jgi:hypothetical protein
MPRRSKSALVRDTMTVAGDSTPTAPESEPPSTPAEALAESSATERLETAPTVASDDHPAKTSDEAVALAPTPKPRFRGWTKDHARGYRKRTDEVAKMLVFQFDGKPDADLLSLLKEHQFRYQPEYFGLEKVWVIKNDFQGRCKAEEIEAAIRAKDAPPSRG